MAKATNGADLLTRRLMGIILWLVISKLNIGDITVGDIGGRINSSIFVALSLVFLVSVPHQALAFDEPKIGVIMTINTDPGVSG